MLPQSALGGPSALTVRVDEIFFFFQILGFKNLAIDSESEYERAYE